MSDSYAREKFGAAVSSLAMSAAPIQRRLIYAHDQIGRLGPHDFSDPAYGKEFSEIIDLLEADKSNPEQGAVPTTCARLSDDDAAEIARRIVELDGALSSSHIFGLEDEIRRLKKQ